MNVVSQPFSGAKPNSQKSFLDRVLGVGATGRVAAGERPDQRSILSEAVIDSGGIPCRNTLQDRLARMLSQASLSCPASLSASRD